MSTIPQISIVIPVYNGSRYLQTTVQSVIDQSLDDFELLIINDGSTDDTEKIALEFQNNDRRIFYCKKANTGVSASRNFGLEKARGTFVVFLDADDIIAPDFLKSRVEFLLKNPQIGLCGSAVKSIDENGNLISDIPRRHAPGENMLKDILYYNPDITSVPSNLMHKRQLLIDNNISFDTRLNSNADKLFLCKLSQVTKSHCLRVTNFYYRVHPASMYHDPKSKKIIFRDSELFVKILIKENVVPKNIRGAFFKRNYYMLTGAGWKAQLYSRALVYGIRYFLVKAKFLLRRF